MQDITSIRTDVTNKLTLNNTENNSHTTSATDVSMFSTVLDSATEQVLPETNTSNMNPVLLSELASEVTESIKLTDNMMLDESTDGSQVETASSTSAAMMLSMLVTPPATVNSSSNKLSESHNTPILSSDMNSSKITANSHSLTTSQTQLDTDNFNATQNSKDLIASDELISLNSKTENVNQQLKLDNAVASVPANNSVRVENTVAQVDPKSQLASSNINNRELGLSPLKLFSNDFLNSKAMDLMANFNQPMNNQLTPMQVVTPTATLDIAMPTNHVAWPQALSDKIVWMTNQSIQSAELHLQPPNMGKIEAHISIDQGQANISFITANPSVKETLENSLQQLRHAFTDSGVNLSNVSVFDNSAQHRDMQQAMKQQQPNPTAGTAEAAHAEETKTSTSAIRINGIVDYYA